LTCSIVLLISRVVYGTICVGDCYVVLPVCWVVITLFYDCCANCFVLCYIVRYPLVIFVRYHCSVVVHSIICSLLYVVTVVLFSVVLFWWCSLVTLRYDSVGTVSDCSVTVEPFPAATPLDVGCHFVVTVVCSVTLLLFRVTTYYHFPAFVLR